MPPKAVPEPPAALEPAFIASMNVYNLRNTLKEWKVSFDESQEGDPFVLDQRTQRDQD